MPDQVLIPAAQYLRASSEHQRYSVPSQGAALALHALAHGYEIVATYVDDGRSGVTITKRDGLKQLLADVLAGEAPFAVVLVLDVSRWGRFQNPDQAAHYEFICREAGVRVRYCAEAFEDDDSTTSSLMKGIKRVMAAEYSRQLSDRSKAGIHRHKQAGGRGGGSPPFAFVRQLFDATGTPGIVLRTGDRRQRIDQTVRNVPGPPEDVATVTRVFRMFTKEPKTYFQIASILNAEGVPYRPGRVWSKNSIRYLLRNEMYVGVQAFAQTSAPLGGVRRATPREGWERVRICAPIVSPALFAAAQVKAAALRGSMCTDDELLATLRGLLKRHGYLTRKLIDESAGLGRCRVYVQRFGSIAEAYRRVGYTAPPRSENPRRARTTATEIEVGLRRLLAEQGHLSDVLMKHCPYLPSVRVIKNRFGTVRAAYKLVGYNLTNSEMRVAAHARRRARRTALHTRLGPIDSGKL